MCEERKIIQILMELLSRFVFFFSPVRLAVRNILMAHRGIYLLLLSLSLFLFHISPTWSGSRILTLEKEEKEDEKE